MVSVSLTRRCPQCDGLVPTKFDRCRTCSYVWPKQSPEERALHKAALVAANQLASGTSKNTLVAELGKVGRPEEWATTFVNEVEAEMNRAQDQLGPNEYMQSPEVEAEGEGKYAKHILFGALWAGGGAAFTLATYSAAEPGGAYFIAWGAIGIGALEFLYGLFGWLANRARA